MARALGATTCSLSACGEASNTRKCTCGPTRVSAKPAAALDATSIFTMPNVHIRALTAPLPIRLTSPSCRSARQPKLGRGSTYRRGNSVQGFGTTAMARATKAGNGRYIEGVVETRNARDIDVRAVEHILAARDRSALYRFGVFEAQPIW